MPETNIVRLDHKSFTFADPVLAWNLFLDWRHWDRFTDFYADLRWTHGTPWSVGSRLRMDVVNPARFVVNRVITVCRAPEAIAWIDHSRGSTLEQMMTFGFDIEGMTRVHVVSHALGSRPQIAGEPFIRFLDTSVKLWLEGFCKECDRTNSRG